MYPNPAGTGYTPYPPPEIRPPEPPPRRSRLGRSQVALVVATIVLFGVAVVLAIQLMNGDQDSGAPPQTTMAVPPPSVSTETETVSPSTSTPSPTSTNRTRPQRHRRPAGTAAGRVRDRCAGLRRSFGPMRRGKHAGRRDQDREVTGGGVPDGAGQLLLPRRTASDGANVQLANAVPAGGGFDVTNPSDGARYEVRPDHLTIYSKGRVDSAEPALEYSPG